MNRQQTISAFLFVAVPALALVVQHTWVHQQPTTAEEEASFFFFLPKPPPSLRPDVAAAATAIPFSEPPSLHSRGDGDGGVGGSGGEAWGNLLVSSDAWRLHGALPPSQEVDLSLLVQQVANVASIEGPLAPSQQRTPVPIDRLLERQAFFLAAHNLSCVAPVMFGVPLRVLSIVATSNRGPPLHMLNPRVRASRQRSSSLRRSTLFPDRPPERVRYAHVLELAFDTHEAADSAATTTVEGAIAHCVQDALAAMHGGGS
ncbi:MAG: hypothetical protein KC492_01030 [Myxococcales bacterium]|nr:hypothetical protein [Myxococcales bacterium]